MANACTASNKMLLRHNGVVILNQHLCNYVYTSKGSSIATGRACLKQKLRYNERDG